MRGDNIKLVVLLCSIILLGASSSSVAVVQELHWEVEYMKWAPDCVDSIVMGINGEFPGPTIRAKAGDTLHIHVTNKLHTEGIVIHWHGIRQLGSPWADGTAAISQCPINPGETFAYIFKVDKAGTYFYHGHYGMQRSAGLYGSVIVDVGDGEEEPFEQYHSELNLLLSDWWHLASRDQEVRLSSKPLHWIGEPQALLLNGKGQYNCSLAASNTFLDWIKEFFGGPKSLEKCNFKLHEKCANPVLTVEPNKVYRLRIASTTALASLNLQIENHKMKVVEADGNYVEPFEVSDLDIYSGESYSVLIKTDQSPKKNYWISVGVRGRKPNTQPGLTILNYKPNQPTKLPTTKPPITPAWNDYNHSKSLTNKLLAANVTNYIPPPKASSRRIILLNTQGAIDGYTKWAINNVSLTLPTTPYLAAIKSGLKELAFDQHKPDEDFNKDYDIYNPPVNQNAKTSSALYEIGDGEVVDVILQNAHMLNKSDSEVHPWHLHGHDFWVLGYGEGRFMAERDEKKFNSVNPPLKNTVVLYPHGWTALRFVGDNPGVWAFHCHIEPHLHLGMGVVFGEALERIGEINVPEQAMACGLTATTAIKSTQINQPNQP